MANLLKANLISRAQKLRNYGKALREATLNKKASTISYVKSNSSTSDSGEDEYTYTYTGYDTEGREVNLTEDQYNKIIAQTDTKNKTYSVIPAEVVNNGTNWWINSDGMYEYVPETEAAKQQLAEINSYRSRKGLALRTTLVVGAAPTAEYSNRWYSTGGGNRGVGETGVTVKNASGEVTQSYDYDTVKRSDVGSGDLKIKKIKESSSVNNLSSAIFGTAQDKEASIITIGMQKEKQALADEDKIRNPLKKYKTKQDYLDAMAAKKEAAKKAKEAAEAYNPIELINGDSIFGIEVNNNSLSEKGIKGIISGEGYYSRGQAVAEYKNKIEAQKQAQKAAKFEEISSLVDGGWLNIKTNDQIIGIETNKKSYSGVGTLLGLSSIGIGNNSEVNSLISSAEAYGKTTANYNSKFFQTIDLITEKHNDLKKWGADQLSVLPTRSDVEKEFNSTGIGFEIIPGQNIASSLLEKIAGISNNEVLKKASGYDKKLFGGVNKGIENFVFNEYESLRTDPVGYTEEAASYYVGGEVFGVAMKGAKVASAGIGELGVKPIVSGCLTTILNCTIG